MDGQARNHLIDVVVDPKAAAGRPLQPLQRTAVVVTSMVPAVVIYTRVAPRLTENRVPGGGYPEPSEPELSRSNSRNRAYLYAGYPGTRYPLIALYGAPKTGVHVDLHIHCAPRISPPAPTDCKDVRRPCQVPR